ncbi:hypothetical protein ES703_108359 [subsurface metagenome]
MSAVYLCQSRRFSLFGVKRQRRLLRNFPRACVDRQDYRRAYIPITGISKEMMGTIYLCQGRRFSLYALKLKSHSLRNFPGPCINSQDHRPAHVFIRSTISAEIMSAVYL